MSHDLLTVVRASEDSPEFLVKSGDVGTIVALYDDREYEVEFCGDHGETRVCVAMAEHQIAAVDV